MCCVKMCGFEESTHAEPMTRTSSLAHGTFSTEAWIVNKTSVSVFVKMTRPIVDSRLNVADLRG